MRSSNMDFVINWNRLEIRVEELVIYPHGDDGLLRSGSAPENESEKSEENEETDNERQKITPARDSTPVIIISKSFFFNCIKSLFAFPRL